MIPKLIPSHFSDEYGSSRRRERNDDFASEGVDLNFSGDSSGSASASEQVPVKLAFPCNTFDGGSKGKGGEKRQPRQVSTGEERLHLRSTFKCDSLPCPPSPLRTGFSSEMGTKLGDWGVGQAGGRCYSQAALSY